MAEFVMGMLFSFTTMVVSKSLLEPIAQRLGQSIIKRYSPKVFARLDTEWLPVHYQDGLDDAMDWLMTVCLPEETQDDSLSEKEMKAIAQYVLNHFDLKTSLAKQRL